AGRAGGWPVTAAATLFDKVWDAHVVHELGDGWALLHVDRHLLHDLAGPPSCAELGRRELTVHDPALTFATPDHLVSSAPDRVHDPSELSGAMATLLCVGAAESGSWR